MDDLHFICAISCRDTYFDSQCREFGLLCTEFRIRIPYCYNANRDCSSTLNDHCMISTTPSMYFLLSMYQTGPVLCAWGKSKGQKQKLYRSPLYPLQRPAAWPYKYTIGNECVGRTPTQVSVSPLGTFATSAKRQGAKRLGR